MKRFFTILLLSFISINIFAEDEIATYSMTYFSEAGKNLRIEASKPNSNGEFTYYIQVIGERITDEVFISIESKYLPEFIANLYLLKNKFNEWSKIAKENNITEMNKEMPFTIKNIDIAWYSSKWWFSFGHSLTPVFKILDDGRYVVTIVKKVTSSSNQYITKKFYIVFDNVNDIDKLIECLNTEMVYKHYSEKDKKNELFN